MVTRCTSSSNSKKTCSACYFGTVLVQLERTYPGWCYCGACQRDRLIRGPILASDVWGLPNSPSRVWMPEHHQAFSFKIAYFARPTPVLLPPPVNSRTGRLGKGDWDGICPPCTATTTGYPRLPRFGGVVKDVGRLVRDSLGRRDPAAVDQIVFLCDTRAARSCPLFSGALRAWRIAAGMEAHPAQDGQDD